MGSKILRNVKPKTKITLAIGLTLLIILFLSFQSFPSDKLVQFIDLENVFIPSNTLQRGSDFATDVKNDAANPISGTEDVTGGNPAGPPAVTFKNPSKLNNVDFARLCKWIGASKCGYVYGGVGQLCTKELCDWSDRTYGAVKAEGKVSYKWIGRLSFDCSGVLRGYSEYDGVKKTFGHPTKHSYGGVDDIYNQSRDLQHGDIAHMPEVVGLGLLVAADSQGGHEHIGYYIGNGYVMDANCSAVGCQIRPLAKAPEFKTWFYIAGLDYTKEGS